MVKTCCFYFTMSLWVSQGYFLTTLLKNNWQIPFTAMVWHWRTMGVWYYLMTKVSRHAFTRCRYGIRLMRHLSMLVNYLKAAVFMAKLAIKNWYGVSPTFIASPA